MLSAASAVALLTLWASIAAVEFFSLNNTGTATSVAQAAQDFLPLAGMGALLAGVASIYGQQHHAAGARTDLAAGIVSVAVSLLLLVVVQPAADVDHGAQARELGMAEVHVDLLLPAAATTSFFLGVALLFAHVRAGGGTVAGEGPAQMPVSMLTKIALGAAAALIGLMVLAL